MVLIDLCIRIGAEIHVVYIDHHTRSGSSSQDKAFLIRYCQTNNVSFTAYEYHHKSGNFQAGAREYRYSVLEESFYKTDADFILTAHHQDDHVESFFLQLFRGAGTHQLKGIQERGAILRPLLPYPKSTLIDYMLDRGVPYVHDRSNDDSHYLRNKIRNDFLEPVIHEDSRIRKGILTSMNHLADDSALLHHFIDDLLPIREESLDLTPILTHPHRNLIIYHRLRKYSITSDQARNIFTAQTGSKFYTAQHVIYLDRNRLIIKHVDPSEKPETTQIMVHGDGIYSIGDLKIEFKLIPSDTEILQHSKTHLCARTSYPLTIRYRENGDAFRPASMKGRRKKLKKYFTDKKVPTHEKDTIPLVVNADNIIIAIIGHEVDHNFLPSREDDDILMISY